MPSDFPGIIDEDDNSQDNSAITVKTNSLFCNKFLVVHKNLEFKYKFKSKILSQQTTKQYPLIAKTLLETDSTIVLIITTAATAKKQ